MVAISLIIKLDFELCERPITLMKLKQKLKRATKLLLKETLRKKRLNMVRKDSFCVGRCNNDRRYSDKLEKKSYMQDFEWRRFPKRRSQTYVANGSKHWLVKVFRIRLI